MPVWIKICANTNLADAQLAAELGASAVGFVFAPSKRQVTAEEVAAITPHLPGSVEKVGVFAPGDEETLDEAIAISGLTALQLHGSFADEQIEALLEKTEARLKLIQVVGFETQAEDPAAALTSFEARLAKTANNPAFWGILLDTAKAGTSGGLGVTFDWPAAAAIVQRVFAEVAAPPKLIIAGGLKTKNVCRAIETFNPYGVDVASGVEIQSEPGRKDPVRLRAFLSAARGASLPK